MDNKKPTGIYFETKKQPFDIKIDNNKKEPKLSKNVRYGDKQNYRRYKSLTEPKLLGRIMVDATDSETLQMQAKIQEILGIAPKKEPERIITAPSGYVAPPTGAAMASASASAPEPEAEAAMASASARAPEPEGEAPWTGYTLMGDLGRVSTGLFEGLSAISDTSREDHIELTGALVERAGARSPTLSEIGEEIGSYDVSFLPDEDAEALAKLESIDLLAEPSREVAAAELFDFPAASEASELSTKPEEKRKVGRPKGTGKRQIVRAKAGEEYRALRRAEGAKTTINPRDYQFDYYNFAKSF